MKKFLRFLMIFGSAFLICAIVFTSVVCGIFVGLEDEAITKLVTEYRPDLRSAIYYYDKDGNEQKLQDLYESENREWIDLEEISEHVLNAAVAIEDERFYKHNGVDLKRTFGAFLQYLTGDASYGGSTITQQLIKNITGEKDQSALRKIREIARAINLEKKMEKDDILEMYLNTFYLGNNCYGIKTAAEFYFAKHPSELDAAEAAAIVGITQLPAKYDPKTQLENNTEKRNIVLKKMEERGYLTKEEYNVQKERVLDFTCKDISGGIVQSYFIDEVINDVVAELVSKRGYTEQAAKKLLYTGGYKIYTTIDPSIQNTMEDVFEDANNFPKTYGDEQPESAMIMIDPSNGYIKAMVGGRGEKTQALIWNRATTTQRQPGSTIKPIAVYAPAVENGLITSGSVVLDGPIDINGWKPKNYYSGYKGYVTVMKAVEQSMNTPAVRVLQSLGIENSFYFMRDNLGVKSLVEKREVDGKVLTDKAYATLSLGGLTDGLTLEELASAYVPFANGGTYYEPIVYTKVLDWEGNLVFDNEPKGQYAMSSGTAYVMTRMLKNVVANGTGVAANFDGGMDICGKTGTTDDDTDRWFVGYTPYYVSCVWVGYDYPKGMRSFPSNPTISVWKKVNSAAHSQLPDKRFEVPIDVTTASACDITGQLAKADCPSHSEYFVKGKMPGYCGGHEGYEYLEEEEETEEGAEGTEEGTEGEGGDGTTTPAPAEGETPSIGAVVQPPSQTTVAPDVSASVGDATTDAAA